jgi:hypothetical protein
MVGATSSPTQSRAYRRTDRLQNRFPLKAEHKIDEYRAKPYSDFHRTLDRKLLTQDVDFVEYRRRNGRLTPVAVIEVTRADQHIFVGQGYLNGIIERYTQFGMQAEATLLVARALNVEAYVVLFRQDCSEFWVYNLSRHSGWEKKTPAEYEEFLKSL